MEGDNRGLVQRQFGANAAKYVTSVDHAVGGSLPRLLALAGPRPDWLALDIATGGGHTALTFAPHCRAVVASDITFQMLIAARGFALQSDANNLAFCQHDARHLPYPDSLFDLVTCRIAPHHFPDVLAFVGEAARVIKPGGLLIIADNVTSGEPQIARFVNTLEKYRDPSHQWAYTQADWETFLLTAGLRLQQSEVIEKPIEFERWAARMAVDASDRERLRALLLQSSAGPRGWLKIETIGEQLTFWLREGIFVAHKP